MSSPTLRGPNCGPNFGSCVPAQRRSSPKRQSRLLPATSVASQLAGGRLLGLQAAPRSTQTSSNPALKFPSNNINNNNNNISSNIYSGSSNSALRMGRPQAQQAASPSANTSGLPVPVAGGLSRGSGGSRLPSTVRSAIKPGQQAAHSGCPSSSSQQQQQVDCPPLGHTQLSHQRGAAGRPRAPFPVASVASLALQMRTGSCPASQPEDEDDETESSSSTRAVQALPPLKSASYMGILAAGQLQLGRGEPLGRGGRPLGQSAADRERPSQAAKQANHSPPNSEPIGRPKGDQQQQQQQSNAGQGLRRPPVRAALAKPSQLVRPLLVGVAPKQLDHQQQKAREEGELQAGKRAPLPAEAARRVSAGLARPSGGPETVSGGARPSEKSGESAKCEPAGKSALTSEQDCLPAEKARDKAQDKSGAEAPQRPEVECLDEEEYEEEEEDEEEEDEEEEDQEDQEDEDATTATTMTQMSDSNEHELESADRELSSMIQMLSSRAILQESDQRLSSQKGSQLRPSSGTRKGSLETELEGAWRPGGSGSGGGSGGAIGGEQTGVQRSQLPRMKAQFGPSISLGQSALGSGSVLKSRSVSFNGGPLTAAAEEQEPRPRQSRLFSAHMLSQLPPGRKLTRPPSRIIFDPTRSQFHLSCSHQQEQEARAQLSGAGHAPASSIGQSDADSVSSSAGSSAGSSASSLDTDRLGEEDEASRSLMATHSQLSGLKCLGASLQEESGTIRRLKECRGSLESLSSIATLGSQAAAGAGATPERNQVGVARSPAEQRGAPAPAGRRRSARSPVGLALRSLFGRPPTQTQSSAQSQTESQPHFQTRQSSAGPQVGSPAATSAPTAAFAIARHASLRADPRVPAGGQSQEAAGQQLDLLQRASKRFSVSSSSLTSKFKHMISGSNGAHSSSGGPSTLSSSAHLGASKTATVSFEGSTSTKTNTNTNSSKNTNIIANTNANKNIVASPNSSPGATSGRRSSCTSGRKLVSMVSKKLVFVSSATWNLCARVPRQLLESC